MLRVFVVDDDPNIVEKMVDQIRAMGHIAYGSTVGNKLPVNADDVVILDAHLSPGDTFSKEGMTRVVTMSGDPSVSPDLHKPVDMGHVKKILEKFKKEL